MDSRDSGVSTRLEADGSFKYRDLPPGEYYLVVNPRDQAPDEDDAPYPRTYYPGVANSSDATRIVVTEGAKLENLTLRLGKPMPERVVTGTVAWHDRRLLKKTHLSLYSGDRYLGQIAVDEKGNFSFKIYGDFPYSVRAQADVHPFGESERVELVDEKLTGIKLTLREIK